MQRLQNSTSINLTLARLEELIILVRSVWPDERQFQASNLNPISSLTSSLFQGTIPFKGQSKTPIKFSPRISRNDLSGKFRKINSFLEQVDTTLEEVIEGISQIYCKIKQHIDKLEAQAQHPRKESNSNEKMNQTSQCCDANDVDVVETIFSFVNSYLFKQPLLDNLVDKNAKQLAIWLLSVEMKLSVLPSFIESACKFKQDITTSGPSTEKYSHAWDKIQIVDMENIKDVIGSQILRLKRMMKIVTSAVVNEMSSVKVDFLRKIVFGLSFPYFLIADQESELKCYKIWRKPKVESLNQVWNIPEMGAIKQCKKITFASIQTNLFIYIPVQRKKFMTKMGNEQYRPQIFSESQTYQCVRTSLLYYKRLKFNENYTKYEPCLCFPCIDVAQEEDLETIMIHLHGGGFVALSSETMQSYTRKWANELKIPIFSIDYRKPPIHRFPIPLEDCLAAYEFIIENIHKYFKIRPQNVILAGDSAGGNLAVSLYASLLMKNYPVLPKGIFLAYPAVDLRIKFSPSRMNSFDDPILLPPLLLLCLKQYLGQNCLNQHHPLASPILLTQSFIKSGKYEGADRSSWPKRWPKTRIMVGRKDPLFDDSLRLLQRMAYAGVDAKLRIYNEFTHAFLSLDAVIDSCGTAINDSIQEIRTLM